MIILEQQFLIVCPYCKKVDKMSYFEDFYLKRLNKYGHTYQSRIQHMREKDFEHYMNKSVYKIDFEFKKHFFPGVLEKYKQDTSQTLQYLLTRRDTELPTGTILKIKCDWNKNKYWMVYYKEEIQASGYNKYILIKLNIGINIDNNILRGYLKGPGESISGDVLKSRSPKTLYLENDNKYLLIIPKTPLIKKDFYFTLGEGWEKLAYRVNGYDIHTNPGIEYVSLDPVYLRDESKIPDKQETDGKYDYFWLLDGEEND